MSWAGWSVSFLPAWTDGQIGAELGFAPATVNKHLEQIYERLGVHTRTAAAGIARRWQRSPG